MRKERKEWDYGATHSVGERQNTARESEWCLQCRILSSDEFALWMWLFGHYVAASPLCARMYISALRSYFGRLRVLIRQICITHVTWFFSSPARLFACAALECVSGWENNNYKKTIIYIRNITSASIISLLFHKISKRVLSVSHCNQNRCSMKALWAPHCSRADSPNVFCPIGKAALIVWFSHNIFPDAFLYSRAHIGVCSFCNSSHVCIVCASPGSKRVQLFCRNAAIAAKYAAVLHFWRQVISFPMHE